MRRHKILVVDDEVPNLRLLRRVLSPDHDILEPLAAKRQWRYCKKKISA
ncbi:MAG: hypothetical protein IPJ49_17050 [Candidatus Obscuribacter sp.]|nr:hypothetical protein [Candidatus Obscuribacter sp.]